MSDSMNKQAAIAVEWLRARTAPLMDVARESPEAVASAYGKLSMIARLRRGEALSRELRENIIRDVLSELNATLNYVKGEATDPRAVEWIGDKIAKLIQLSVKGETK